jgi:hypothetical protein
MMRPAVGVVMPSSMWMVVVFPAPFGPSNPTIRPRGIVNDRWSTARNGPKSLTRSCTSSKTAHICRSFR